MDAGMTKLIFENPNAFLIGLAALIVIMLLLICYLMASLSSLKSRYGKMMTGGRTGADFEQMMLSLIDENRAVNEENKRIESELSDLRELLTKAITRVGVVRFNAFADTGSDLSYAVALLDSENNGVVLSSIFARDDSRSYAKPITEGRSSYTLSKEEQQALKDAAK